MASNETLEETSKLRHSAHISPNSACRLLWDFFVLDGMPESTDSNNIEYLRRARDFWRPQGGKLEVPTEWSSIKCMFSPPPSKPYNFSAPDDTDIWLAASLLCAIISHISSHLSLIAAVDLFARCKPDYCGPHFSDRPPPYGPCLNTQEMVDILLCDSSVGQVYQLASSFVGTFGCQLKIDPGSAFSPQFGENHPQINFACVPEWQPVSKAMIDRFRETPLRLSSPALAVGIEFDDQGSNCGLTADELTRLADAVQPHLEAVLVVWHRHHCLHILLAFRDSHVFIVAHIPYVHLSEYRYRSILVDQLPFPPHLPGTNDQAGFIARLHVIIALRTIQAHIGRLAALWEGVGWPLTILDSELALAQGCSGIQTPTPSDPDENDSPWLAEVLLEMDLPEGHEIYGLNPSTSDIRLSKEIVDNWMDDDVASTWEKRKGGIENTWSGDGDIDIP